MNPYLKKTLKRSIKGVISFNKHLKDHTTFRIGGKSEVWVEPLSLEDLRCALRFFSEARLEPFVIGSGSNILAYDGRIKKAVIRLSSPYFKRREFGDSFVICGSGHKLSSLINRCIKKGLSGLEGLAGIPGTVGGAIMMNAGRRGNNIGDVVEWVKVIDYKGRRVRLLNKDSLRFNYRDSGLSNFIMLEAKFLLKRCNPKTVQKIFIDLLKKKKRAQEYRWPNAGCIFKNPKDSNLTSGQLLDQCGLKGLSIKDAQVSNRHANFIINKGKAQFKDVISLIKLSQDIVKRDYGIDLEPEIRILK